MKKKPKTYGAFVTVRYWCPDLFSEEDAVASTPEGVVEEILKEEGVLGVSESERTLSVTIVAMPDYEKIKKREVLVEQIAEEAHRARQMTGDPR